MAQPRMSVVKDRRSSLRVEVEGRARIHTERDAFDGRCVDLGLDGIAVRSARAARPGELVTLDAQVDGQRLRLEATLVRRQRAGGEYHLGLAFVEVDLDTQRRIEHLLFARLARSPQGDFMRAFAAHADRVPPPAAREGAHDRTMVAGTLMVPVISGHTQIVAVDSLPTVDRTVIAPPPPRSETVLADARPAPAAPPEVAPPGVPDDAWLDDEMDTAQFRLLEVAQATEAELAEDDDLALLEPDEAEPDHTVVVGGFAVPPRERTVVTTDAFERPLHERTLVTADTPERPLHERTLVTADAFERPLHERTLVTADATERPLHERTLVTADAFERPIHERTLVTADAPERPPREHTVITGEVFERPLRERTLVTGDGVPEPVALTHTGTLPVSLDLEPSGEPVPELPADRTLPFLRELLRRPSSVAPAGPPLAAPERTAVIGARAAADAEIRPTQRALLDATAMLRRPDPEPRRRGPRVIVSVPHRTYRRAASTPWNQR